MSYAPGTLALSAQARIRARSVIERETGCWLWTGYLVDGYGRISFNGRKYIVHRFAYRAFVGPIPDGMTIDHVRARGCIHRHCVNPAHLEPVPIGENLLRGDTFQARNAVKTHCDAGHEFTEENTYVRRDGSNRGCRACRNAASAAYRERKRRAA